MAAASSTNYSSTGLKVAVLLIFFLECFPSKPVGLGLPGGDHKKSMNERVESVGSRPPECVNKCLSCNPCMATLVIRPHQWKPFSKSSNHEQEEGDDDNYYLLSWKCKCGNKLFQP